jgi:hypothetical protein
VADKAFGMGLKSGGQDLLALLGDDLGLARVHHGGGQEANAAMMMFLVVPGKKLLAKGSGILKAAKLLGKGRLIFEGFELSLGAGIVIGDMGPTVAFGDAQIG